MTIKNVIPKFLALLLISLAVSFLANSADSRMLAKADSMSNADFIAYVRGLHQHSFLHNYVLLFITAGLLIAGLEFLAYVIGFCFKKKPVP
jgi:hypothetical protein